MTSQELKEKLEEYSPFRINGYNEIYSFKSELFFVGDKRLTKFEIIPDGNGFKITTENILFQFWKNIKVVIDGEEGFPIIVNYDSTYSTPRSGEENGYLILKSIRK
jgi:hypothetical protein